LHSNENPRFWRYSEEEPLFGFWEFPVSAALLNVSQLTALHLLSAWAIVKKLVRKGIVFHRINGLFSQQNEPERTS
jgi:hypothetical protein